VRHSSRARPAAFLDDRAVLSAAFWSFWTGEHREPAIVQAPTPAQLRASGAIKISAALHALELPSDTPIRFHAPGVAEIVKALLDCPQSVPFRHSVNKRDIPDYDKVRTA